MFVRRSRSLVLCAVLLSVGCSGGTSDDDQPPTTPVDSFADPTRDLPPRPPGVYLDVAVSGSLEIVVHRIEFERPVSSVEVSVPAYDRTDTGAGYAPRITQLSVEAPGREPRAVKGGLEIGSTTTIPLSPATASVVLRYVVRGAVRQSKPATAGRALALVGTLSVVAAQDLQSTLTVSGPVLNVGCTSATGSLQPCGQEVASGWRVQRLAGNIDLGVFAQVDNP